ncbi:MAG: hypothetical protein LBI13_01715 [Streptococcaceae bacterium]|jgi:hypothetical protein|nr:hypothetical protein [Streptococcaceae bacterium]
MEIKICLADSRYPKQGRWFILPSREAEQLEKEMRGRKLDPVISEIVSDFPLGNLLEKKALVQMNQAVTGLLALPPLILDDLDLFLAYESLEELVESEGSHFKFHEGSTLEEVAEDLVASGEIAEFWSEGELLDYLDYAALGRDLPMFHPFFEGTDGMIEYRK